MEQITLSPATLKGNITVPPSKSAAHRMLLCAALSGGVQQIGPICHSNDIDATLGAIRTLGAKVTEKENVFIIEGISEKTLPTEPITIDCGESGSTLRFLIPVVAALGVSATFIGHGRLPNRPINELTDILEKNGVSCSSDHLPLTINGKLTEGTYEISGNISSQYLTGLLLALPLLEKEAQVKLASPLESAGYIDMTMETMLLFGVTCTKTDNTYKVQGKYTPYNGKIEGDWSQACFFIAAAAMGQDIEIKGLLPDSTQGDRSAMEHFSKFGLQIKWVNDTLYVARTKPLTPVSIDCSQIPDMVPALAITAALANGVTKLFGAARLRIKESDRIKTTLAGLHAMGIFAEELEDGLIIHGGAKPSGGMVDGAGDHRIVMAFSILAAAAKSDTIISGFSAIDKSYPDFFKDYQALGGKTHVI